MYDAVLISTHYNYNPDGIPLPGRNDTGYDDLSMTIPLGLIHIAQYLHDSDFHVRVVHLPHEMHRMKHFGLTGNSSANLVENILKHYPARACGIQAHWYLYCGGVVYIADLYKQLFPESRIVLGGYMATTCWKEFLEASNAIDGIILGEGEKAFRRLLEKTSKSPNSNQLDINGVAARGSSGEVVFTPADIDNHLALEEIPTIHPDAPPFRNVLWQKRHFISISRGQCPETCAYCAGNNKDIHTRTYQTIAIDKIIEQLHVYQNCGFRDLFLGENHFLSRPFMTDLIENISKENFKMVFELETHPMIFENKYFLEKMIDANFLRFTMGCESGSDSVLKRIGRRSSSAKIITSVKEIAEQGGIVLTSWISNLPGETESEFEETQQFMHQVLRAGGFIYWIENLHVFPGTRLYNNPKDWDIEILLTSLNDWIRWSLLSKQYVSFEDARKNPLKYLTHLNHNTPPEKMIDRFYSNRKLAVNLIPEMKCNLENRSGNLPAEVIETEMKALDWYETEGWKLWLF